MTEAEPDSGVMVYVRTADGNDALAWVNEEKAVAGIQTEQITTGGQLGKPSSARRRV